MSTTSTTTSFQSASDSTTDHETFIQHVWSNGHPMSVFCGNRKKYYCVGTYDSKARLWKFKDDIHLMAFLNALYHVFTTIIIAKEGLELRCGGGTCCFEFNHDIRPFLKQNQEIKK